MTNSTRWGMKRFEEELNEAVAGYMLNHLKQVADDSSTLELFDK